MVRDDAGQMQQARDKFSPLIYKGIRQDLKFGSGAWTTKDKVGRDVALKEGI